MLGSTAALQPDLVFLGGNVLTVDNQFRRCEALAVDGDRIVALGTDAEVRAVAGPRTTMVDLRGRTLLPGFCDTHAHLDREGLRRVYPSLATARSIPDVQDVVRREVARARPGEWIVLMPLGEPPFHLDLPHGLTEDRYPDRWDLDAVAPDNPVYIRAIWNLWNNAPPFVAVANSLALQRAGVNRDTEPPCDTVTIEKDPLTGEPTGRLMELSVYAAPVLEFTLMRAVPRFTPTMRVAALREAMRLHNAAGTTSTYEGHGAAPELQWTYKQLWDRGESTVRPYLVVSPTWGSIDEAEAWLTAWGPSVSGPGFGDEWLKLGGVFLSVGEHRTIADILRAELPYTGWAGFLTQGYSAQEFRTLSLLTARHGLRLNSIAGFDVGSILDVWEEIDRLVPRRGRRDVLVHGTILPPADLARIRQLGAVVTTNPSSYLWRSGLDMLARGIGEDALVPHQSLVEAEIPWALSTDNKPYQLLWVLWTALARRERKEGRIVGPDQRIARAEGLRALTWAGAYCCFEEHRRGSLELGKLADLVLLSADPMSVPVDEIKELTVELTMVGGRIVHSAGSDLPPIAEPGEER